MCLCDGCGKGTHAYAHTRAPRSQLFYIEIDGHINNLNLRSVGVLS